MNLFRALKGILISGVIAAACSVSGARGLHERFTYEEPRATDCAAGVKDATWVTLSGCEAVMEQAVVRETSRHKIITSISVPLRPVGSGGEPTLVLDTHDEKLIAAARRVLEGDAVLERKGATGDELLKATQQMAKGLQPIALPEFQARVEGRTTSLDTQLPTGVYRLRHTEAGKPGVLWPLFLLVCGLIWGLVALGGVSSLGRPAETTA